MTTRSGLALQTALAAPPPRARPVAGGELQFPSLDSTAGGDRLFYEILDANGQAWVQLGPPDAPLATVPASALLSIERSLETHFPDLYEGYRMSGVGLSPDGLSVGVAHTLPLPAVALGGMALGVALTGAVLAVRLRRLHRRAATFATLARHQTASREAERSRIAREIHDGPVQDLSILALEASGSAAVDADRVRTAAQSLREIAAGLRPAALDRFGLATALRDLAHATGMRGTAVRLDLPDTLPTLTPSAELAVYRIVQEAIQNAVAHGQAARITVRVALDRERLTATIDDDGTGLPPGLDLDRVVRSGHFGLAGMFERAQAEGGLLALGAVPDHAGTRVTLTLPVRPA